jgi:serine/threonine-protein kinase RsbW
MEVDVTHPGVTHVNGWTTRTADARESVAALSIPMDEDFLTLARMIAAHVGGLLGLSADRTADLRLAVDEACTLLLAQPAAPEAAANATVAPGGLELDFVRDDAQLRVTVCGPARSRPDQEDVGWYLLQALVADVHADYGRGRATVTLVEPVPGRG